MLSTIVVLSGSFLLSILASVPLYVAEEGEERYARITAILILIWGLTILIALTVAAKVAERVA